MPFVRSHAYIHQLHRDMVGPEPENAPLAAETLEERRSDLEHALADSVAPERVLAAALHHGLGGPASHDARFRSIALLGAPPAPEHAQRYPQLCARVRELDAQTAQATERAAVAGVGPQRRAAQVAAANACMLALGPRHPQTHAHLRALALMHVQDGLLAEASHTAARLFAGHAELVWPRDEALIAAASNLWAPEHLSDALAVAGEQAALGMQTLAWLQAATQDGACRRRIGRRIETLATFYERATDLQAPSAAPPPLTDERLAGYIDLSLACVQGSHADAIVGRVVSKREQLLGGAQDNRAAARIWLQNFLALVTGYDVHHPEMLPTLQRGEPCPLLLPDARSARAPAWPRAELRARLAEALRPFASLTDVVTAVQDRAPAAQRGRGDVTFAFWGPSGTGKSSIARALAEGLFEHAHIGHLNLGSVGHSSDVQGTNPSMLSSTPSPFVMPLLRRGRKPVVLLVHEVCKGSPEVQNTLAAATEHTEAFAEPYFQFPIYLGSMAMMFTYNEPERLVSHLRSRIHGEAIYVGGMDLMQKQRFIAQHLQLLAAQRGAQSIQMPPLCVHRILQQCTGTPDMRPLLATLTRVVDIADRAGPHRVLSITLAHVWEALRRDDSERVLVPVRGPVTDASGAPIAPLSPTADSEMLQPETSGAPVRVPLELLGTPIKLFTFVTSARDLVVQLYGDRIVLDQHAEHVCPHKACERETCVIERAPSFVKVSVGFTKYLKTADYGAMVRPLVSRMGDNTRAMTFGSLFTPANYDNIVTLKTLYVGRCEPVHV